jgi:H+/gluconate symporter-like permease
MEDYFGEAKMNKWGVILTTIVIIFGLGMMIGSLVWMLTGGAM